MVSDRKVLFVVIVAALGYFVDIYDLLLFGIVRNDSLRSLGLDDESDECAASVVDALTVTRGALVAADYVSLRDRARWGGPGH